MKKLFKSLITLACVGTLSAGVAVMATGCGGETSAYGLVHGGGYVGCAHVEVVDGEITEVTLNEVCLPTQVKNGADYYETVKYNKVVLTWDADANDYVTSGGEAFKAYLASEANAKAYYEAVMNNKVTVVVDGVDKNDVMTKATLSKDENGYWTRTDKDGNSYSRWQMNRDATVAYVLEHGVDHLLDLVKGSATADPKEDKQSTFWMDGTISTGATWNDLNPAASEGYFSYAELILKAYELATK